MLWLFRMFRQNRIFRRIRILDNTNFQTIWISWQLRICGQFKYYHLFWKFRILQQSEFINDSDLFDKLFFKLWFVQNSLFIFSPFKLKNLQKSVNFKNKIKVQYLFDTIFVNHSHFNIHYVKFWRKKMWSTVIQDRSKFMAVMD